MQKNTDATTPTAEVAQADIRHTVPQITSLSPSSPSNRLAMATALFRDGQFDLAKEELSRALAENPELAEGQLVKGLMLASCKQFDQAIEPLNLSIELDPDADVPYLVLISAYDELNKSEQALKTVESLLKHHPEHAAGLGWQGTLLRKIGRDDEALESWKKASLTSKPEAKFHSEAAQVHLAANRWSMASAELDNARVLDPRDPDVLTAQGDALYAVGRIDEAAAIYRHALSHSPMHAPLYHRVGRWFWDKQHKPAAIALLRTAVQLDPTLTDAHKLIAEYYQSFDRAYEGRQFAARSQLNLSTTKAGET